MALECRVKQPARPPSVRPVIVAVCSPKRESEPTLGAGSAFERLANPDCAVRFNPLGSAIVAGSEVVIKHERRWRQPCLKGPLKGLPSPSEGGAEP